MKALKSFLNFAFNKSNLFYNPIFNEEELKFFFFYKILNMPKKIQVVFVF